MAKAELEVIKKVLQGFPEGAGQSEILEASVFGYKLEDIT